MGRATAPIAFNIWSFGGDNPPIVRGKNRQPRSVCHKLNVDRLRYLSDFAAKLDFIVGAVAGISRPVIVAAWRGSLISIS